MAEDSQRSYSITPTEMQRFRREKMWDGIEISSKVCMEPYLELYNLSTEEALERGRKQTHTIQQTNVVLQQRLKEYVVSISTLKEQLKARQLEYDELMTESEITVQGTETLTAQLQALREQRISEECRLRAHSLELHERMMSLTQENARLEAGRHEEEKQLKQGCASIGELILVQEKLELRKAALQHAYDSSEDEDERATPQRKTRQSYRRPRTESGISDAHASKSSSSSLRRLLSDD